MQYEEKAFLFFFLWYNRITNWERGCWMMGKIIVHIYESPCYYAGNRDFWVLTICGALEQGPASATIMSLLCENGMNYGKTTITGHALGNSFQKEKPMPINRSFLYLSCHSVLLYGMYLMIQDSSLEFLPKLVLCLIWFSLGCASSSPPFIWNCRYWPVHFDFFSMLIGIERYFQLWSRNAAGHSSGSKAFILLNCATWCRQLTIFHICQPSSFFKPLIGGVLAFLLSMISLTLFIKNIHEKLVS